MDYITYLRLQEEVGYMGLPRFSSKAPFYIILHVGTHLCIVCPKLDNCVAYFKGQNILPFSLPTQSSNSLIHSRFNRQSPLHTLFEVFLMNSYECISMVNAINGVWSHHMNDNILSTLVILRVVTFNKLPSFWQVVECVVCIFQINFFWYYIFLDWVFQNLWKL